MVCFHGGGLVLPSLLEHLVVLAKFVRWSQDNLAIFCVVYTLAPNAQYLERSMSYVDDGCCPSTASSSAEKSDAAPLLR